MAHWLRTTCLTLTAALLTMACDMHGDEPAAEPRAALEKSGEGITERYWKLTELMGQPVGKTSREPHLILKADDNRVSGSGGCNGMGGSYELKEPNRIHFSKMMSTMMACADGMDVEQKLHQVLEKADSYDLDGDRLVLNRARMAPLARFEAVVMQ